MNSLKESQRNRLYFVDPRYKSIQLTDPETGESILIDEYSDRSYDEFRRIAKKRVLGQRVSMTKH